MPTYVIGDATRPEGDGPRVICHCVNDVGMWGSGFVLALNARWPRAEKAYRAWARHKLSAIEVTLADEPVGIPALFELGSVQFVEVEPSLWVANLVGQHRTIHLGEAVPVRYEALEKGFDTIQSFCRAKEATAHMPRIGAGLARGDWSRIEAIIDRELPGRGISATVYDLPGVGVQHDRHSARKN